MNILDRLNAYHGGNLWQDVILPSDEYDAEATDAIDRGTNDRFVARSGRLIRYDAQREVWVEDPS